MSTVNKKKTCYRCSLKDKCSNEFVERGIVYSNRKVKLYPIIRPDYFVDDIIRLFQEIGIFIRLAYLLHHFSLDFFFVVLRFFYSKFIIKCHKMCGRNNSYDEFADVSAPINDWCDCCACEVRLRVILWLTLYFCFYMPVLYWLGLDFGIILIVKILSVFYWH